MSDSEAAYFRAELRKLAAEIGPKLSTCQSSGQLSCGCHLIQARESIHAALHAFNPNIDERNLNLDLGISSSSAKK